MWSAIRSAYAWVLLSVLMLALFPTAALVGVLSAPFDRRRVLLRRFVAAWVAVYGRLSPLYRFRLSGRERLPSGAYVLVANHESGLDVLCLLLLRAPVRFLAESWMFRIPLAGALFRACRHIPVDQRDRDSGQRALAAAAAALAEGSPVAIFPEGRLSPDGLAPFKPGAFVLAKSVGVPVVPVRITGTGRAWRPGTMVVRGTHAIAIDVCAPITAAEVARLESDALAARARRLLAPAGDRGVSQAGGT